MKRSSNIHPLNPTTVNQVGQVPIATVPKAHQLRSVRERTTHGCPRVTRAHWLMRVYPCKNFLEG